MTALLTLSEAAEELRLSTASVRRLVRAGRLPLVQLGRAARIDPADLSALVYAAKARPAQGAFPCLDNKTRPRHAI